MKPSVKRILDSLPRVSVLLPPMVPHPWFVFAPFDVQPMRYEPSPFCMDTNLPSGVTIRRGPVYSRSQINGLLGLPEDA
jgi:hypothetical protein